MAESRRPRITSECSPFFLPMGIMMFMFMVIMMSAQPMLESVLEEKTNRIAEVLLGSASPLQIMAGKLLGNVAGIADRCCNLCGRWLWTGVLQGCDRCSSHSYLAVVRRIPGAGRADVQLDVHGHRRGGKPIEGSSKSVDARVDPDRDSHVRVVQYCAEIRMAVWPPMVFADTTIHTDVDVLADGRHQYHTDLAADCRLLLMLVMTSLPCLLPAECSVSACSLKDELRS